MTATVVQPGTRLGRGSALTAEIVGYRLDGQLAEGRRGPILGGVRRSDGLAVVVHLVDRPLDARQKRRLRAEAARLQNVPDVPELLPVIDAGFAADGRAYFVTPRADRSLADRLAAEGPVPLAAVAAAGVAAATGLAVLHRAGLLHGNLTPANLLVLPSGSVALADAAIPVLAELDGTDPGPGQPPEVLQGGEWSEAADVYALGWTLFTLLAGRPPYGATRGAGDVLLRVLTEAVPELPELPELVGDAALEEIRAAVRAALAKDPQARPSPAAMTARLRGSATTTAGTERRDTLPPTVLAAPDAVRGAPLGSGYLLQEPIGCGAAGKVWKGVRRADARAVAVKVLRPELTEDPEAVARFLGERTTLVGIAHPNVVQVRDLVVEGSTLAIVMDLVDGPDLRQLLAESGGRLDPATAARLLAQVAAGLAAVHSAGVVHRDVKPENVLVERRGTALDARLTDFGIARLPAGPALTRAGRLTGTPEYVAPEQATGRTATPASDVYSFGVMAYEVLAGRRPFDAPHPVGLLRAHVEDEPARPADLAEPAWQVVRACLAKAPADRPTAAGAATSLAALAPVPLSLAVPAASRAAETSDTGNTGVEPLLTTDATVPAPPAPAVPQRRRTPRLPLALAALVVAVVGGVGGLVAGQVRDDDSTKPPPSAPAYAPYSVEVPVVAFSPEKGRITLQFSDGPNEPGFQFYVILRNGRIIEDDFAGAEAGYNDQFLDPAAKHCYRVWAIVKTTVTPSPRPAEKACLVADGKSVATTR